MDKWKPRYVVQKHGFWYWQPTKKLKEAGFNLMRLSDVKSEAYIQAERINADVDAWRKKGAEPNKGTMGWLRRVYTQDDAFKNLKPRTRSDYIKQIEAILAWTKPHRPVASLTPKVIKAWYLEKRDQHGERQAKYRMQVLSILMNFAITEGVITINPCKAVKVKTPKPRSQLWEREDIDAILKVAPRVVRRAILLALYTGQRPGDVLKMTYHDYNGQSIMVTQAKTNVKLEIVALPELQKELADKIRSSIFLVPTYKGTPFKVESFDKEFGKARAAAGVDAGLRFNDFRRTSVVNLARAGCTVPEIVGITGHSINTCQTILDTYLPKDRIAGANGIAKLHEYRKKLDGLR